MKCTQSLEYGYTMQMRQWIYQYPFINEKNWGSRVGLLRPTARQSGFFLSGFCSLQIHFILVNNSRSLGSHFILCYFSFRKPKCPRISTANHGPSIKEVWRIQFIPPPPPPQKKTLFYEKNCKYKWKARHRLILFWVSSPPQSSSFRKLVLET